MISHKSQYQTSENENANIFSLTALGVTKFGLNHFYTKMYKYVKFRRNLKGNSVATVIP